MTAHKAWVRKAGIILISTVLLLTFFSNTIYTYSLPAAAVAFWTDGVIRHEAIGEGVVGFSQTERVYAAIGGRLTLWVVEGAEVGTGNPLYTIEPDMGELSKSLDAAQLEAERIELNMNKISADIAYTRETLENTTVEANIDRRAHETEMLGYDQELSRMESELAREKDELNIIEILLEVGAVPESDAMEKQNEIKKLEEQYRQMLDKKQRTEDIFDERSGEAEAAAIKSYASKKRELEKTIEDLECRLEEYALQQRVGKESIRELTEQINNSGAVTAFADENCVVVRLSPEIAQSPDTTKYVQIDKNAFIMELGFTDEARRRTTVSFDEAVDYVREGDTLTVSVKSRDIRNVDGTVVRVSYDAGRLYAEIVFPAEAAHGGETAEVRAEKVSGLYPVVLPNSAVHKDEDGNHYILYAEKVRGALGYEYYARETLVRVLEQDGRRTACVVIRGEEGLSVIIKSDKPIRKNDRIKITDERDIIESK